MNDKIRAMLDEAKGLKQTIKEQQAAVDQSRQKLFLLKRETMRARVEDRFETVYVAPTGEILLRERKTGTYYYWLSERTVRPFPLRDFLESRALLNDTSPHFGFSRPVWDFVRAFILIAAKH